MASVHIKGIDTLVEELKKLPEEFGQRKGSSAVFRASKIIQQAAKSYAAGRGLRLSGALIENIAVKRDRTGNKNLISYHVGVRHGRNAYKAGTAYKEITRRKGGKGLKVRYVNDPFYWWYHEFGAPGRNIPARPFLRPAFESNKVIAFQEMIRFLERSVKQLNQKAKIKK